MKFGLTKTNNSPSKSLSSFRRDVDTLFDDFFNLDNSNLFDSQWLPDIDLIDEGDRIVIKADVAGIEEKDIDVRLENDILTISGQRSEEKKESNKNFVVSERKFGSFTRSINLPRGIKAEDISAELKNGVLNLTIKKDEKIKSKQIKIAVK
jgi:HSP20 family protein